MSPRELTKVVSFDAVMYSLAGHYPHIKWHPTRMKKVYNRIKTSKYRKPKKSDERLAVYILNTNERWGKKWEIESYYSIHTIETEHMDLHTKEPKQWGMSFRPWTDTMSMKFTEDNFKNYSLADMLAHYIYEITWHGTEKQTAEKGKKMYDEVAKITKDIKDGKKVGQTYEEVFGKKKTG